MVASVPVVVASFAHRLSAGCGGAATSPFCIAPEVAAGFDLIFNGDGGVQHGPETWPNAGSLN